MIQENIDKHRSFTLDESQTQNATYYLNSSYMRKRQNMRGENRSVVAEPRDGRWADYKRHEKTFLR